MVVFIGWWLGVITPMKRVVFTSGQVFLSDITFFSSHLYMVKRKCWPPNQQTSEASNKKNYLWITTKWNNPHNIGITV